jgi:hypothetical protein
LTITYLLVEFVDQAAVEPRVPERTFRRLCVMVILPAVDATYTMGTGALIRRGRENREGSLLGVTLAATSMITMLLPSMRLGADRTPASSSTVVVCVPPLAASLAEGDTGVTGGRADEAGPAEDVDGLVVQGRRAGPSLGVPDVEVYCHRGGVLRFGLDHSGTSGRAVVRVQGRSLERAVDVRVDREVSSDAEFRNTVYDEIRGGLRKTDPQIAGPVGEYLGDPPSRGIQVAFVGNIRSAEAPTPIGLRA